MSQNSRRPHTGLIVSLPMALALVALFFMPWMEVSCASDPSRLAGAPSLPPEANPMAFKLKVSGWQLARGEFTIEPAPPEDAREQMSTEDVPKRRRWVYGLLGIPALLSLVSLLGLAGALTTSSAGKLMALLCLIGLCFLGAVWSLDYLVDDVMAHVEQDAEQAGSPMPASARRGVEQAREQLAAIIKTTPTVFFWASMGLYGAAMVTGMVCSTNVDTPAPRPTWQASTTGENPLARRAAANGAAARTPSRPVAAPNFRSPPQDGATSGAAPAIRGPAAKHSTESDDETLSFGEDIR